jgi:hypothetical protein
MLRMMTIESFSERLAMSHVEALDRTRLARHDDAHFGTRLRLATIVGSALLAWGIAVLATWGVYSLFA